MKKLLKLFIIPALFLSACNQNNNSQITSSKYEIEIEATNELLKEDVTVYREGLKIAGELYTPKNSYEEFPLVIMSHGFGGNMEGLRDLSVKFAKEGFATFIYDFIGGGYSIKSDGQLTDMSVLTEAKDLNAVLDYLLEDERINADNIFLLGQSQGGFVSTYVSATRDDIKALVDYYPAFVIRDDAEAQYSSAELVPDPYKMTKMGATLGKIYYVDATSFDIYDVMADYQGNTLIMHGTSDNIVPYSYSQRAAQVIPHCELVTYDGAGHGFNGQTATDADSHALEFVKNNLN